MYHCSFGLELSHQVARTAPLQPHENGICAPKDDAVLATGMARRCTPPVPRILLYILLGKLMACGFDCTQIRASHKESQTVTMRVLLLIILGTGTWSGCTAAGPMEGCKLAIMDFKDPAFGLPTCNEDTRWLRVPFLQVLHLGLLCAKSYPLRK